MKTIRRRSLSLLLVVLTALLSGCGFKNFFVPATGGLAVSIEWPQRQGFHTQAIPERADYITVRISGEGLFEESLQARIARSDLQNGTLFDAVPVGRKQISAEAFAGDGTRLAAAREDFQIRGGALNEVEVTMRIIPQLRPIEPGSAPPGGRVTLRGENFGSPSPSSAVYLGPQVFPSESVVQWTDNEIVFDVPPGTATGRQLVVVLTGTVASAPQPLDIQGGSVPAPAPTTAPSPAPVAAPASPALLPVGSPTPAPAIVPVPPTAAPTPAPASSPPPATPAPGTPPTPIPVPVATATPPVPTPLPTVQPTPVPTATPAPISPAPIVVTLAISPNTATINAPADDGLSSGDLSTGVQLVATVIWSDGTVEGDVIWTSSDTSRAIVDGTGRVTAVANAQAGIVTITATSRRNPSFRATATVTVNRKGQGILIIS